MGTCSPAPHTHTTYIYIYTRAPRDTRARARARALTVRNVKSVGDSRAPSGSEGKRPAALLVATAPSRALLRTPESTVMGTPESTELGSEHGASRLPTPAPVGLVAYSDSESEG